MATLNPHAAPFVPVSFGIYGYYVPFATYVPESVGSEDHVTEAELEELEACEEWVRLQADLEELEREHLVSLALSEAPPEQILAVEMRAGALEGEKHNTEHHAHHGKQRRKSKH